MTFSVKRSTDAQWETAPWIVLCDGRTYLNGIQEENEARAIVDLLNHATPQIIPMRPPSVFSGMRLVSSKLFATKRKGMRQTPDSPRDAKGKWIHQRGSILLEFCLVLPIFLLLILGGFDLITLATAKSNVDWISQQVATCTKAATCPAAQVTAQSIAGGFGMNTAAVTATAAGNVATVGYLWQGISPFFSPTQLQSTATAP